ncbi:MAG: aminotransferase class I/II-fold pyridoxal phosphate-dependent enzyme [Parachlamydiaceae bacterium]|nr:aminotransferase class I/II-fold pyridoxal phosphate-dependent enzyme [Parachlamydiaceae bacterium]
MRFSTKAIHAGYEPDPETGSIMPPIYMTSTYILDAPGETRAGYDYTRAGNPNFTILEKTLAALEEAEHATVFSSGLGALTAMISMLSKGDHVVALEGLYGGTYRLFKSVFVRFGIELEIIKLKNSNELDSALAQKPKWLLLETPTNPLLNSVDIEACAQVAKKHGVFTVVDNTFATPYFQNPLRFGADIVWHSTTKYIGGHSDVIGGAVITNSSSVKHEMDFMRKAIGVNPSPFDTWLTTRGLKTLALRMERHAENGMKVAKFLEGHPKVSKVFYPGLTSHSSHEIAKKQMRGFGGMVSAEFDLSIDSTKKLASFFTLFALAESLGGVESLVCHPATMTHASIPVEDRHKSGLNDGLLRFSVGVEDGEDLIDDLSQALDRIM